MGASSSRGLTNATSQQWVRRVSPSGALQSLETIRANFLDLFPDGNVYMGLYTNSPGWGVMRYFTAADQIDPEFWITSNTSNDYFDTTTVCSNAGQTSSTARFCGGGGAELTWSYNTGDEVVPSSVEVETAVLPPSSAPLGSV
jgi:hypothetical protein